MLIDGLKVSDNAFIENARVTSGATFPAAPDVGLMFYLDTAFSNFAKGLYVFDGNKWITGDVTSVTAGMGLLGGGQAGDIELSIDGNIVTLKSTFDALSADVAAHNNDSSVHLTSEQNQLLDGVSSLISSVELNHLDGLTGNIQSQINSEKNSRIASDDDLLESIGVESSTRSTIVNQLQSAIDTDEADLAAHKGDTSMHLSASQNSLLDGISSAITSTQINHLSGLASNVQSQFNNEISSRSDGDNNLQNQIDAESASRASADLALQGAIDNLESSSTSGINTKLDKTAKAVDSDKLDGLDSSMFMRYRGELGSTEDINNFRNAAYAGIWHQASNSETSVSRGYPSNNAGMLEVMDFGGGDYTYQRYTTYDGFYTYFRTFHTAWSSWKRMDQNMKVADSNLLDGIDSSKFVRKDIDSTVASKLYVSATPSSSNQVTNKAYVDQKVNAVQSSLDSDKTALSSHAADTGKHLTTAQNALLDGVSTAISSTEINHLDGLSGNIQAQINTEKSTRTNADNSLLSKINSETSTRSSAISALQTALDTEEAALLAHKGSTSLHLSSSQNALLDGISSAISPTEINYLDGLTGNIQSQINKEKSDRATALNTKLNVGSKAVDSDKLDGQDSSNFMRYRGELGSTENLNNFKNLTYAGFWHQGANAEASTSSGYPVNYAGMLEVIDFGTGDYTYQRYTIYDSRAVYYRTFYQSWSSWKRMDQNMKVADSNLLDGVNSTQFVRKDADSTVTSRLYVNTTPTTSTQVANKGYVDNKINSLIGGAPSNLDTLNELAAALNDDANLASNLNTNIASKLAKTGGSMSGYITLHANPSSSMHAVTKTYVDTAVSNVATETPVSVTSTYTAKDGDVVYVNTASSAVTVHLPASPAFNTVVEILDAAGTFQTRNLTIGRNGQKIMGLSENMLVNTQFASFKLRFYNSTYGWRVVGA